MNYIDQIKEILSGSLTPTRAAKVFALARYNGSVDAAMMAADAAGRMAATCAKHGRNEQSQAYLAIRKGFLARA